MTDNEIIKALECCADENRNCTRTCPFFKKCGKDLWAIEKASLDLINRQQAEIEVLSQKRANIFEISSAYERGRAEAIKQFADKTKGKFDKHGVDYTAYAVVDDVAREVAGDN